MPILKFMMGTIDLIYEYHIEWDRVNCEREKREA
jgi:hypothetical protein